MKRRTSRVRASIVAVGLLGLLGCQQGGSHRLDGRWRRVRAEGGNASAAASAFVAHVGLEFRGDRLVVVTPEGRQAGRFRIVKETAANVIIATDVDGIDALQTFVFAGERALRWPVNERMSMVFVRQ